jgi:hypothetical protein
MSDDFDEIFNRCWADIAAGRETIDSCLKRYPAQAGRLAALLKLAKRIQVAPRVSLPDDKRRVLEARLLKQAKQLPSKPVSRPTVSHWPHWRQSVALLMASIMALVLLMGTAISVSAASVPGDFLYPLKRATEQVRLAVTPTEQQTELHLEFAQERLQELSVLQARGEVSEDLLAEISDETTLVLESATSLAPDRQPAVLRSLTDFQAQHTKVLAVMASAAQGEARAKVLKALAHATSMRKKAEELLAGAASTATPAHGSAPELEPTIVHGNQSPGKPATRPNPSNKPEPQVKPTKSPPTPQRPASKDERTPPGHGGQATPQTPAQDLRLTKQSKP